MAISSISSSYRTINISYVTGGPSLSSINTCSFLWVAVKELQLRKHHVIFSVYVYVHIRWQLD